MAFTKKDKDTCYFVNKVRLYETIEQNIYFHKNAGCSRKVYNLLLNDAENHKKETGKILVGSPASYKKEYPYLKEVDSLALCNSMLQLKSAYKNYFDGIANYPTFKSKKNNKVSFTTNNQILPNGSETIKVSNRYLTIPKLKTPIRIRGYKTPPVNAVLKHITISLNGNHFYASLVYEVPNQKEENVSIHSFMESNNNKDIVIRGVDWKPSGAIFSNGETLSTPQNAKKTQKRIGKAQRKLSKKTYQSKNYEKQRRKVRTLHQKHNNQMDDFIKKSTKAITKQCDILVREDISFKYMKHKKKGNHFSYGKNMQQSCMGKWFTWYEQQAKKENHLLLYAPKHFPSTRFCSNCFEKGILSKRDDLTLKNRVYHCPCCNFTCDRDKNAARNLELLGYKFLNNEEMFGYTLYTHEELIQMRKQQKNQKKKEKQVS